MQLTQIHTYLIRPERGEADRTGIGGTAVDTEGKLFELLNNVYQKSDDECDIDIIFTPAADGRQENDCRNLIVDYAKAPTLDLGRTIAERLAGVTTHRSGLGLLFLLHGNDGNKAKLVVSRFPADSGILAEENASNLSVAFLERVFMKSAHSYKAVLFNDTPDVAGFWEARAIDKQINASDTQISHYWIRDFLTADFVTTAEWGTRRLAKAIREAISSSNEFDVKQELTAAATLSRSLSGKKISIDDFVNQFGLSEKAQQALYGSLPATQISNQIFEFNLSAFKEIIAFRSMELDNGAVLSAEADKFDKVFHKEDIRDKSRFTTEGRIVNEKLRKTR